MSVTPGSQVGIVSNPDNRPENGANTLVTSANWSDPNKNKVTTLPDGNKPVSVVKS